MISHRRNYNNNLRRVTPTWGAYSVAADAGEQREHPGFENNRLRLGGVNLL